MDFSNYNFFVISLTALNLFSFMLGATWAFFNQGIFGKKIGLVIFAYFALLSAWYALHYYMLLEKTGTLK